MKIAIIGSGDVGRCYAQAFNAAGHSVAHLCDSAPRQSIIEFASDISAQLHSEPGPWLGEADLIVSAVFGGVALGVAEKALPFVRQDAIYADFTTGSANDLFAASQLAAQAGVRFVDVAIVGAISISGAKTPLLCAGSASQDIIKVMSGVGAPIHEVGSQAGDAVSLKLLRSVFTKGMEALAVECLLAAEQRGLRTELYDVLSDLDQIPIRKFMEVSVTTHVRHAGRRLAEVREASQQLTNEGVSPLALAGVEQRFQTTSAAINRSALTAEPTVENSLEWLYKNQQDAASPNNAS